MLSIQDGMHVAVEFNRQLEQEHELESVQWIYAHIQSMASVQKSHRIIKLCIWFISVSR